MVGGSWHEQSDPPLFSFQPQSQRLKEEKREQDGEMWLVFLFGSDDAFLLYLCCLMSWAGPGGSAGSNVGSSHSVHLGARLFIQCIHLFVYQLFIEHLLRAKPWR